MQLKKHYDKPVHHNPFHYRMGKMYDTVRMKRINFDLPVTEKISKLQVSVPIYPGLNKEEVLIFYKTLEW